MSDTATEIYRETIPAESWVTVTAFVAALIALSPNAGYAISWQGDSERELVLDQDNGLIRFAAHGQHTLVSVVAPQWARPFWTTLTNAIERAAAEARNQRRMVELTPPDRAIERYYRIRAQGSKITLRKIAAQYGMSYEALKKHKQRYDARGGWGSKKGTDTLP